MGGETRNKTKYKISRWGFDVKLSETTINCQWQKPNQTGNQIFFHFIVYFKLRFRPCYGQLQMYHRSSQTKAPSKELQQVLTYTCLRNCNTSHLKPLKLTTNTEFPYLLFLYANLKILWKSRRSEQNNSFQLIRAWLCRFPTSKYFFIQIGKYKSYHKGVHWSLYVIHGLWTRAHCINHF